MKDHEPTVRSRELGLAILRAAQARGLSGRELGRLLQWSDSKVSRLYSGKRGASPADVAAILAICGIKSPKRDELVKLAHRANERGWWQEYGDRLPPELTTLTNYEDAAITVVNYENVLVPGLLQTAEYTRAILQSIPTIPASELDERMGVRILRRQALDRQPPAAFRFFIDEMALTRKGPGREIMSEQVHHLLRLSVRSNIEIRIISDSAGIHAGHMPFKLMGFSELSPVVHIECPTSVLFLERKDTIAGYRRTVANLDNVALDEQRSRAWLADLAKQLGAREDHDEYASALEEDFPK
ncbi:MAG TPA: helix-turn-helix transcriptional regulator [Actinophytocola sp.]|jgi:transcriptional regulator with XRE-family HTH domain|uniref:helix-turn-helix domain-containing protein n=1 Tax=Actinophytocola sp. TaxID=1872138 RepID=UPI002DFCAF88|nr:helix-turn-helix transcriptional regulator [Actinophytocola sp.]